MKREVEIIFQIILYQQIAILKQGRHAANSCKKSQIFFILNVLEFVVFEKPTDGPTDGLTDGQSLT